MKLTRTYITIFLLWGIIVTFCVYVSLIILRFKTFTIPRQTNMPALAEKKRHELYVYNNSRTRFSSMLDTNFTRQRITSTVVKANTSAFFRSVTSRHNHSSYGHCQNNDKLYKKSLNTIYPLIFSKDFVISESPFKEWLNQEKTYCKNTIRVYHNLFGLIHNVKINPDERDNVGQLARGGERVENVKDQSLDKEDYAFKRGFYEAVCNDTKVSDTFRESGYDKLQQVRLVDSMNVNMYKKEEKFTIAIARGDYANLWNHMFELYGVFIIMMVFKKTPDHVSILFLDGHPSCLLDKNWEHIFGPVQRVGHLKTPVIYNNLVWGFAENQIELSKWENPTCPYIEEFREFVLSQYGIKANERSLNCKRLTFTFIVRRNQVYHPRNLEGNVERKIFNELDVIETLMGRFPGVCIQALLMESIPMSAQLEIISETDILIGMHGAGMMHSLFLPLHAGVVELFPRKWRETRIHAIMYEVMASKWRRIHYGAWENADSEREFSDKVTIVDSEKVYEEVKKIVNKMCLVS